MEVPIKTGFYGVETEELHFYYNENQDFREKLSNVVD